MNLLSFNKPAAIDQSIDLTRDIKAVFTTVGGRLYDHVNKAFPSANTAGFLPGAPGIGQSFASTTNTQFATNTNYNLVSAMTIAVLCDVNALTGFGPLVSCQAGPQSNGWELRLGVGATDSKILAVRQAAGYEQFPSSSASDLIAAGSKAQFIAVKYQSSSISTAPTFFINGVGYTAGTPTGNASGTQGTPNTTLWIGRRSDGATQLNGTIYWIGIWGRELRNDELNTVWQRPWRVFAPRQQRRHAFYNTAGDTTRTPDTGSISQTGVAGLQDRGILTSGTALAFAGLASPQDKGVVTQAGTLAFNGVSALVGIGLFPQTGELALDSASSLLGGQVAPDSGDLSFSGFAPELSIAEIELPPGYIVAASEWPNFLIPETEMAPRVHHAQSIDDVEEFGTPKAELFAEARTLRGHRFPQPKMVVVASAKRAVDQSRMGMAVLDTATSANPISSRIQLVGSSASASFSAEPIQKSSGFGRAHVWHEHHAAHVSNKAERAIPTSELLTGAVPIFGIQVSGRGVSEILAAARVVESGSRIEKSSALFDVKSEAIQSEDRLADSRAGVYFNASPIISGEREVRGSSTLIARSAGEVRQTNVIPMRPKEDDDFVIALLLAA